MFIKRDNTWKFSAMENVLVGDYIVDSEGDTVQVESVDYIDSFVDVISIDTEIKDMYFASDILVHNMYAK